MSVFLGAADAGISDVSCLCVVFASALSGFPNKACWGGQQWGNAPPMKAREGRHLVTF